MSLNQRRGAVATFLSRTVRMVKREARRKQDLPQTHPASLDAATVERAHATTSAAAMDANAALVAGDQRAQPTSYLEIGLWSLLGRATITKDPHFGGRKGFAGLLNVSLLW